ncbi:MAG: pitrilysin family protein [Clostridia bacterium]
MIVKNNLLEEEIHYNKINGLDVYICKKNNYEKKIAMFGTKYGSLDNTFEYNNEKIKVPDGVAHFLEHKLFEQEGENALDLFAKEGISANAYTSFDQTVYFFETIDKYTIGLEMLIKLVKTPYFTDENVIKEQGIIGQEIAMYDDSPEAVVYYNALRCMYKDIPLNIDIAGTKETISKINKDILYKCYNTFYNLDNMFMVIVGDVNIDESYKLIQNNLNLYENNNFKVKKYIQKESKDIVEKEIVKDMGLSMPMIYIGYKLDVVKNNDIIKREVISDYIFELFFSKSSKFYIDNYNKGYISSDIEFVCESNNDFSHILVSVSTSKLDEFKPILTEYINNLKNIKIDINKFENVKKKMIGEHIFNSEELNNTYRYIIDSILNESKLYIFEEYLKNISLEDIKDILDKLTTKNEVISIVK